MHMIRFRLKGIGSIVRRHSQGWLIVAWLCSLGLVLNPAPALSGPLHLGMEAVEQQDYSAAVQYFSDAIAQHERLEAAYGNRCLAHLLMNEPQHAIEDCTAALRINPVHPRMHFYRGLAQYRLAHYEAATADFTWHLQQHPHDAHAHYNRGLAAFAQGQVDAAIVDYQRAVTHGAVLTPVEKSNFYNDLGVAYLANTQLGAARSALDQAVALSHRDPRAYFNRGCVCQRQGNYDAALQDFERVLALDPQHAETYFSRGLVRQQMGYPTEAIADLRTAIKYFQQRGNNSGAQRAKVLLQQLLMPVEVIG